MIARSRYPLGSLGAADTRSYGAALWEWWNPELVQAEYAALGKPVPSVDQIRSQAIYDASVTTGEAAGAVVETFSSAGVAAIDASKAIRDSAFDFTKILTVGAIAALVLFLLARK